MKRAVIIALILIIALLGGIIWNRNHQRHDPLTLFGNVDVRQVDIGFRVAGKVERLYFDEGNVVNPGDLLATLEESPYDQQFIEAQNAVKVARANFENSEFLLKRRRELIGVGGVSEEDLQTVEASYNEAVAELARSEAQEAVAKANLGFTKAFSPTQGIILTRVREPGTVVNPADPVYTVSISSPVWVRAYVDEPRLGLVEYGMKAEIYTDMRGGRVYTGKVGFISPVAEFTPKTVQTTELRTDLVYRLRIYADNPDQGLKQGMPVTVKLLP